MKLTKSKLKEIIKEELRKVLKEQHEGAPAAQGCQELRKQYDELVKDAYDHGPEDAAPYEEDIIKFMKRNENCFQAELGELARDPNANPMFDHWSDPDAHEEDAPGSFPTGLEGLPGYTQLRGN